MAKKRDQDEIRQPHLFAPQSEQLRNYLATASFRAVG